VDAWIDQALSGVFGLMLPELVLGTATCVLFIGATFRSTRHTWAAISLAALVGAAFALFYHPVQGSPYASPLVYDSLAVLMKMVAIGGGVVLVLFSWDEVPDHQAAEYYACLLAITAGLCLTVAANELVTLFLALELISIPTYVLLYLPRHDVPAQEAATKYFLISIFSSALLLFGFSYLYGLVGTTNLPALVETMAAAGPDRLPLVVEIALVMVVAGLGFRITAVPFHFYAPDVYQGTPTVAAALLAFVPKVAGFVALMRIFGLVWANQTGGLSALGGQLAMLFWILAVVSMSLGNVLALLQNNLKRLLAYSSIAHAGYMLIGLAVASQVPRLPSGGLDAVLFYLVAYGAMTIGAFAVLSYLSTPGRPVANIDDLAGLSQSHPGTALVMALFLFSLIGIPLTAGFFGKLILFFGALTLSPADGHPWLFRALALIAAVNAAIGAWYYLRILAAMYLRTPVKPIENKRSVPAQAGLALCAAASLAFGLYPNGLLQFTRGAVQAPAAAVQNRPLAPEANLPASQHDRGPG
jgi:NADH-quinone oxidoreductase subunit N